MKKKKCPKCGKPILYESNISRTFDCHTFQPKEGAVLVQSELCKKRVKVAKLKNQVEKLKIEAKYWREHHDFLQDTVTTLRNPNF